MTKLNKKMLAVMILCGFSILPACSSQKGDLQSIKDAGKIVVGITDYEPMDYKEKGSDTWIGFDADLANSFAKKLGVNCEFVEIDWDSKTTELSSRNIDLIWNGMTADDELDKSIDFSVAYSENNQCVVVKKGNVSNYDTVAELKAANSVAVENGSAGNNAATNNSISVNAVETQKQALLEVVSNQSQAAIIDYTMAYSVVGKGSYVDLEIVDTAVLSFEREVFAVGLRTNSDLIPQVNSFFKEQYTNGTLATLSEKYGVALNESALKSL